MKILNESLMRYLSFPDMDVIKMEFSPENKKLNIFVEGSFLDIDNVGILGEGILYFSDWQALDIRQYDSITETWQSVINIDADHLTDLCEVQMENPIVALCGFGKKTGNWMEWRLTNVKMSAQFEDRHPDF